MPGLFYALNVGTMTVWTTAAGIGLVSMVGYGEAGRPVRASPALSIQDNTGEGPMIDMEPESGSPEPGPNTSDPAEAAEPEQATPEVASPPELEAMPEMEPLPEIPEMPDIPAKPAPKPAAPAPASTAPKTPSPAKATTATKGTASNSPKPGNGTGPANGNGKGTGTGQGNAPGNGKAGGQGDRLRKGRLVKPVYPPSCKAAGQTGTVTVEITVDASGKVIAARVTKPAPYPEMNQAAVNTAYRWSFPSGEGTAKAAIPVVFRLND